MGNLHHVPDRNEKKMLLKNEDHYQSNLMIDSIFSLKNNYKKNFENELMFIETLCNRAPNKCFAFSAYHHLISYQIRYIL